MPLKTQPLEEPGLNLTSLLDVILTIVMFFMLSTTFNQNERQTDIQVPSVGGASALSGQPDEIVINVAVDGIMKVNGEAHSHESLLAFLQSVVATFPSQSVVIRGDGRCEYQRVMDVFSTCKQAGVRSISMAHVNKPERGA